MSDVLRKLGGAIRERQMIWWGTFIGFVVTYYVGLLVTMLVRFENLPNYVTFYNWPSNVWRILTSTPSLRDSLEIIREEWLVEIGYMNYDFGHGISEWALNIIPPKLFLILIVAALIASVVVLLMPSKTSACPASPKGKAIAAASGGATLVGLSSATLSWVVCCATPTWVVSLAMMGMSVSLALWLEPLGDFITIGGFLLLAAAVWYLARLRLSAKSDTATHLKPISV
jgi:hypothetical protein